MVELLNSFGPIRTAPVDRTPRAWTAGGVGVLMRVVTVGRIAPQKDPEIFIQILSALRASGCIEATWVGDGTAPARTALENNSVAVTGWLPAGHVPAAIAGQSVYLHTARWEAAVPIAVLDALDAGLPIVVRRNRAYRSMLPEEWQFDDVASAVRMIPLLPTSHCAAAESGSVRRAHRASQEEPGQCACCGLSPGFEEIGSGAAQRHKSVFAQSKPDSIRKERTPKTHHLWSARVRLRWALLGRDELAVKGSPGLVMSLGT